MTVDEIVRWKSLKIPQELRSEAIEEDKKTRFVIEPLEKGMGHTMGNCLRRVLLSSIEGCAVIGVSIDGVSHEFSVIESVLEDVPELQLKLREVVLEIDSDEVEVISFKGKKGGKLLLGDFEYPETVVPLNKDLEVISISEKRDLDIKLYVARGRGFKTAEEHDREGLPEDVVFVDSFFSPIKNVAYEVTDTRVGHLTNYDGLTMDITTDGSIPPYVALNKAVTIWSRYLSIFETYPVTDEVVEESDQSAVMVSNVLDREISEFELSVRSMNCLSNAGIKTLRDLVKKSQSDLLSIPNFGKRCLNEMNQLLESQDLKLGMEVD